MPNENNRSGHRLRRGDYCDEAASGFVVGSEAGLSPQDGVTQRAFRSVVGRGTNGAATTQSMARRCFSYEPLLSMWVFCVRTYSAISSIRATSAASFTKRHIQDHFSRHDGGYL